MWGSDTAVLFLGGNATLSQMVKDAPMSELLKANTCMESIICNIARALNDCD